METNPDDQSPWPEVKTRLERLDEDEVVEALRRDAEIESDRTQAITLEQLNTQIQNRRK